MVLYIKRHSKWVSTLLQPTNFGNYDIHPQMDNISAWKLEVEHFSYENWKNKMQKKKKELIWVELKIHQSGHDAEYMTLSHSNYISLLSCQKPGEL